MSAPVDVSWDVESPPEAKSAKCDGGDCGWPCAKCGGGYGTHDVPDCVEFGGKFECDCAKPPPPPEAAPQHVDEEYVGDHWATGRCPACLVEIAAGVRDPSVGGKSIADNFALSDLRAQLAAAQAQVDALNLAYSSVTARADKAEWELNNISTLPSERRELARLWAANDALRAQRPAASRERDSALQQTESYARESVEAAKDLAEAVGLLQQVHATHPQPEICAACAFLTRLNQGGGEV